MTGVGLRYRCRLRESSCHRIAQPSGLACRLRPLRGRRGTIDFFPAISDRRIRQDRIRRVTAGDQYRAGISCADRCLGSYLHKIDTFVQVHRVEFVAGFADTPSGPATVVLNPDDEITPESFAAWHDRRQAGEPVEPRAAGCGPLRPSRKRAPLARCEPGRQARTASHPHPNGNLSRCAVLAWRM